MSEERSSPSTSTSAQRPSLVPTTISEWQLMAVLQRANLRQYYEDFISKGGDDVNQIIQCEEGEFLEIMKLVGMTQKPLHVRRLQRALMDFSKDPTSFNMAAIQFIGAPPPSVFPNDHLQLFLPNLPSQSTSNIASTGLNLGTSSESSPTSSHPPFIPALSATANVLTGDFLSALQESKSSIPTFSSTSPIPSLYNQHSDDFVALGDYDPNTASGEPATLSDAQITRIAQTSQFIVDQLPPKRPKLVQNKKRISKELLDLMTMSSSDPRRLEEYRRYAAIYGRFDAKRKADKALTLHEVSVNEAAAQIALHVPALLTRRDELFTLARKVVKDAGYHYVKNVGTPVKQEGLISTSINIPSSSSGYDLSSLVSPSRKRPSSAGQESLSERSSCSTSPVFDGTLGAALKEGHSNGDDRTKRAKSSPEKPFALEQWAADRIAQGATNSD